MSRVDVAIVGGGIGGSSLAGFLARAGLAVLVLEREPTFVDRVRGEWIAPWGVAELRRLGLYDRFLAAGAHHLSRHIGYDEPLAPEQAENDHDPTDCGVRRARCHPARVLRRRASRARLPIAAAGRPGQ